MHSDEVMQSCPLLCECGRLLTSDRMKFNFYLHMHVSVIWVKSVKCVDAMIHLHPHTFQGAWLF